MTPVNVIEQLKRDEGLRLFPYFDTVGKTTVGYGRNLSDIGISVGEADLLLENDIQKVTILLTTRLPYFDSLDPVRQGVLANMAFNLGFSGLEKFQKMLASFAQGNWDQAADQMLSSKWATQVGARAQRLAQQTRTGQWV